MSDMASVQAKKTQLSLKKNFRDSPLEMNMRINYIYAYENANYSYYRSLRIPSSQGDSAAGRGQSLRVGGIPVGRRVRIAG